MNDEKDLCACGLEDCVTIPHISRSEHRRLAAQAPGVAYEPAIGGYPDPAAPDFTQVAADAILAKEHALGDFAPPPLTPDLPEVPNSLASEILHAPEKRSAWTDAQREDHVKIAEGIEAQGKGGPGPEITGLELDPGRDLTPEERKALPPWAEQLRPGRGVAIDGWNTRIVLIDPVRSMVLLFVEGPTQEARKRVERIIKRATKRGTSKTPKGTKPPPRKPACLA